MDSLIKIEGQPLEKLIDTVTNALGTVFEPWCIKRKAKAEAKAEAIKAIEQAKTKAIIDGDTEKALYYEHIDKRLTYKEYKRQKNIDTVVSNAGNILSNEKNVSNEKVNEDWTTRFFDIVQDVSDTDMQLLWGQILAGEIKQPKSYSLRTLEILRNMTKEEAELFQKVAQFVIVGSNTFILSFQDFFNKNGIHYIDIAKLVEIGLFQQGDFVSQNYMPTTQYGDEIPLIYGNKVIIIRRKPQSSQLSLPIRLLSTPGQELVKLVTITPTLDYVKELANSIKKDNINVFCYNINIIHPNGTINFDRNSMIEF